MDKMTRWIASVAAAGALALLAGSALAQALPGGTLDPTGIPKYVEPLIIPPEMPPDGLRFERGKLVKYYEIEVVQFDQQILPTGYPETTVWSYGAVGKPETRNYPAFTIEAWRNIPTRVKWVNSLVDADGNYLPHLLTDAVDQTLHWANPPMDCADGNQRTDCRGTTDVPYQGPVPIVTHVHGAHVGPESDGYPEAWWLPAANDIPAEYATDGALFDDITGTNPGNLGYALFEYPNDQEPTTLWYHDHTLGMTRLNVYAGPAGFYLLRDLHELTLGLPGPAPKVWDGLLPFQRPYYEIPIVIQDRSFNEDGSLFYPTTREFFDGFTGPYAGDPNAALPSDIAPIWNPEAFFNTMVVNGRTWPNLDVEKRKYRLRLLNGCNSRFLILKFDVAVPTQQIGSDGGLLSAPVAVDQILLGPAERADVVVDFSALPVGTTVKMLNVGPDEPFKGFNADGTLADGEGGALPAADLNTTGQVMQFTVGRGRFRDRSRVPATLTSLPPVDPFAPTRRVTLNEEESGAVCFDELGNVVSAIDSACVELVAPKAAVLGTLNGDGTGNALLWSAPITENPAVGATETWEIYNLTEDAHPIHLHLVQFRVLNRQPIGGDPSTVVLPEARESGWKDTVIAYPGQITRIQATFDREGLYVWHCHILEHEDNEMMRPYYVGDPANSPVPVAATP